MCLLTHPHSLHLGPERIQQLKQDQTQRVNVHFMGVRVSRELRRQKNKDGDQLTLLTHKEILYETQSYLRLFLFYHSFTSCSDEHLYTFKYCKCNFSKYLS